MTAPLTSELHDLLERAAGLPYGLLFLEQATVACVSTALGVPPAIVEQARAALEDPVRRALFVREFEQAIERRRTEGPRPRSAPARPWEGAPPRRGPEELVEEARRHPLGLEFLLRAPLESVAVTFSVHPFVVLGAREIVSRQGGAPAEGPEGDAA